MSKPYYINQFIVLSLLFLQRKKKEMLWKELFAIYQR